MSLTPRFQGVFSQSEGRLGQAVKRSQQRDVGQALNFAIQKQNIELGRENQRLKREQFEFQKRAADLAAAQEANMAPFKIAKLEQDLRAGEAKIDSIRSNIADKVTRLNIDKAAFLSERLGSVDSQAKLATANKALMNLGILDSPIETVGQAQILFRGSKNFQLQTKLANEAQQAKDKQAFEIKARQEQARLNAELTAREKALGFTDAVALEKLKQQGRERLVQQKAVAGQGGGINVNIDPSLFQGQAQGLQQRQFGGRAGESELDKLNREIRERGEAMNRRASRTFEDQLREEGIDTSLQAREKELGVNRKLPERFTFEQQLEREGIKQFRSFEEQLEFERRQREIANRPIKEILEEIGPREEIFRQPQTREELARQSIESARTGRLQGRQTGGQVGNEAVIVGENSPEVFIPDQPGTVVPTNPQDQAIGLAQGNITPEEVQLAQNAFNPIGEQGLRDIESADALRQQLLSQEQAPIQAPAGGQGQQQGRKMSGADITALSSAQTGIRDLDRLLDFQGEGKLDGALNQILQEQLPGETLVNFFRTGDQQEIKALKNNVTSIVVKIRSGAAVTDKERAFLSTLLPKPGDEPETQVSKLQSLRGELQNFSDNITGQKIGLSREPFGSVNASQRRQFIDDFLKANAQRGATREDALRFIKAREINFGE